MLEKDMCVKHKRTEAMENKQSYSGRDETWSVL